MLGPPAIVGRLKFKTFIACLAQIGSSFPSAALCLSPVLRAGDAKIKMSPSLLWVATQCFEAYRNGHFHIYTHAHSMWSRCWQSKWERRYMRRKLELSPGRWKDTDHIRQPGSNSYFASICWVTLAERLYFSEPQCLFHLKKEVITLHLQYCCEVHRRS